MAPGQLIETKDLPPEVLALPAAHAFPATAQPVATAAQEAPQPNLHKASEAPTGGSWEDAVQALTLQMLEAKTSDVWDVLCKRFETAMIQAALLHTGGRKVEAAAQLGMGRNTMTRKVQELGLE
jgi:two-component system nitrogen regulation response regulator GlnG